MAMQTSPDEKQRIKTEEGLWLVAKGDIGGVPTVGYGTTVYPNGDPVKIGDKISSEQADAYFTVDLAKKERAVNALVTAPLTQPQFDAIMSFVYNVGVEDFRTSTFLRLVNQGQYRDAAAELPRWDKARVNGVLVDVPGLLTRRKAEQTLFLSGTSQPAAPK